MNKSWAFMFRHSLILWTFIKKRSYLNKFDLKFLSVYCFLFRKLYVVAETLCRLYILQFIFLMYRFLLTHHYRLSLNYSSCIHYSSFSDALPTFRHFGRRFVLFFHPHQDTSSNGLIFFLKKRRKFLVCLFSI